jgi:hypothetical protein
MNSLQRKSPSFWDDLHVPAGTRPAHLFSWLDEVTPMPEEHDYVLSTDGSGCIKGWGASAAIVQKVIPGEPLGRVLGKYQVVCSATYGSTVQRRELSAFLDGLYEILRMELEEPDTEEPDDEVIAMTRIHKFSGDNRITVLWYTDRANLAKSLLFDEDGSVLNKRTTETDLWMRYSTFARHFCITPMWVDRNSIPAQKACDAICTVSRAALLGVADQIKSAAGPTIHESWNLKRPQKAPF